MVFPICRDSVVDWKGIHHVIEENISFGVVLVVVALTLHELLRRIPTRIEASFYK